MTYEWKKAEREREEKKQRSRAEIAALCAELEQALALPAPGSPALKRQAQLLDHLLYAVMRRNLSQDIDEGHFSEDRLNMVLRIQKQCANTIKANAATEYMRTIAPNMNFLPPLPHPLENGEQSEES